MPWFTSEFHDFFKQLAANNNKDWFHEHRKEYQEYVREPMKAFTERMIEKFTALEPGIKGMEAHQCIFRINNDIRFNPDRPLYKMHMGAAISSMGRKSTDEPGFYFQFGPENSFLAGGCYKPSKEGLYKIRLAIKHQPEKFHKLIEDLAFRDVFGELAESERNKRLPREFMNAAKDWPILFNKQFYYSTSLPEDRIFKDDLDEWMFNQFVAAEELREFLREALKEKPKVK